MLERLEQSPAEQEGYGADEEGTGEGARDDDRDAGRRLVRVLEAGLVARVAAARVERLGPVVALLLAVFLGRFFLPLPFSCSSS